MKSASPNPRSWRIRSGSLLGRVVIRHACAVGWLLLSSTLFLACHEKSPGPVIDSNTNWLTACTDNGQCNNGNSCLCGLCTRSCESSDECSAAGVGAQCLSTQSGVAQARCESRGQPGVAALCAIACETGSSCSEDTLQCVDELCERAPVDAVRQVVAGGEHTCALLANNTIKCWGNNGSGQLGQGDVLVRGDGPNELGIDLLPVDLGTTTDVRSLSAGTAHTCALLVTGEIKCWGDNASGQLGLGDVNNRGDDANELGTNLPFVPLASATAIQVSAGADHTCALFDDGRVACWGGNLNGELGIDTVFARGDMPDQLGANLQYVDLGAGARALQVVASSRYSCALLEGNSVKCWGRNQNGQLGQGDIDNRGDSLGEMSVLAPIPLGDVSSGIRSIDSRGSHVCIRLGDGAVRCWGFGGVGQLGVGDMLSVGDQPDEMGANLVNSRLGGNAQQLVVGAVHTCAVLTGNALKCWGQNNAGQLGLGDVLNRADEVTEVDAMMPSVMLPSGTIRAVTAGNFHTCVLLDGEHIYCFGENQFGQLGRGTTERNGDDATEQIIRPPAVTL